MLRSMAEIVDAPGGRLLMAVALGVLEFRPKPVRSGP